MEIENAFNKQEKIADFNYSDKNGEDSFEHQLNTIQTFLYYGKNMSIIDFLV